jgi:hypothetical protein
VARRAVVGEANALVQRAGKMPWVDNVTCRDVKFFLECCSHTTGLQAFLLVRVLLPYLSYEDSLCTSGGKISHPKLSQVRRLLRRDRV